MPRAEVEDDEEALRSKLLDTRWPPEVRRVALCVAIGSTAIPILLKNGPIWAYQLIAGVVLVVVIALICNRYRREMSVGRWLAEAKKADYMLCPDCGHDLRPHIEVEKNNVLCPECGRWVAVADLKEIWAE